MNKKLLDILVCPRCHHTPDYQCDAKQLVCSICRFTFAVKDDIPIMLNGCGEAS